MCAFPALHTANEACTLAGVLRCLRVVVISLSFVCSSFLLVLPVRLLVVEYSSLIRRGLLYHRDFPSELFLEEMVSTVCKSRDLSKFERRTQAENQQAAITRAELEDSMDDSFVNTWWWKSPEDWRFVEIFEVTTLKYGRLFRIDYVSCLCWQDDFLLVKFLLCGGSV